MATNVASAHDAARMGIALMEANLTIRAQARELSDLGKVREHEGIHGGAPDDEKSQPAARVKELLLMAEQLKHQREELMVEANLQQERSANQIGELMSTNASLRAEVRRGELERLRIQSQLDVLEKMCTLSSSTSIQQPQAQPQRFQFQGAKELENLRSEFVSIHSLEITELRRTISSQEKLLQVVLSDSQQEKGKNALYRRLIDVIDAELLAETTTAAAAAPPVEPTSLALKYGAKDCCDGVKGEIRDIIADLSHLCDENQKLMNQVKNAEEKNAGLEWQGEPAEAEEGHREHNHQQHHSLNTSPRRSGEVPATTRSGEVPATTATPATALFHHLPSNEEVTKRRRREEEAPVAPLEGVEPPTLLGLFGGFLTSNLACHRCGHIQAAEFGLQAISHTMAESPQTVLGFILADLNAELTAQGSECSVQPISHLLQSYGTTADDVVSNGGVVRGGHGGPGGTPGTRGFHIFRPSAVVTPVRIFLLLDQQTALRYLQDAPLPSEVLAYKLAVLYLVLSPQLICTSEFIDLFLDQIRFLWIPLVVLESEYGDLEERVLLSTPPTTTWSHSTTNPATSASTTCITTDNASGRRSHSKAYVHSSRGNHHPYNLEVSHTTTTTVVQHRVGKHPLARQSSSTVIPSRAELILQRLLPRLDQAMKIKAVFASFLVPGGGIGATRGLGGDLHETAVLSRLHPSVQEELQQARPSYHFFEKVVESRGSEPSFDLRELCRQQVENL